jgi:hypothetical protein
MGTYWQQLLFDVDVIMCGVFAGAIALISHVIHHWNDGGGGQ